MKKPTEEYLNEGLAEAGLPPARKLLGKIFCAKILDEYNRRIIIGKVASVSRSEEGWVWLHAEGSLIENGFPLLCFYWQDMPLNDDDYPVGWYAEFVTAEHPADKKMDQPVELEILD